MQYSFQLKGIEEFIEAIKRNPMVVKNEIGKFVTRTLATYMRTIKSSPWRMNQTGGGVPVATGNLRDTHLVTSSPWGGFIMPLAPYAGEVHQYRPWLDYSFDQNAKKVEELEKQMMDKIISDLKK